MAPDDMIFICRRREQRAEGGSQECQRRDQGVKTGGSRRAGVKSWRGVKKGRRGKKGRGESQRRTKECLIIPGREEDQKRGGFRNF